MDVYLVYKQTNITTAFVVRVFLKEEDAHNFCKDQNYLNNPGFDEWGYCEGIYHMCIHMKAE